MYYCVLRLPHAERFLFKRRLTKVSIQVLLKWNGKEERKGELYKGFGSDNENKWCQQKLVEVQERDDQQ